MKAELIHYVVLVGVAPHRIQFSNVLALAVTATGAPNMYYHPDPSETADLRLAGAACVYPPVGVSYDVDFAVSRAAPGGDTHVRVIRLLGSESTDREAPPKPKGYTGTPVGPTAKPKKKATKKKAAKKKTAVPKEKSKKKPKKPSSPKGKKNPEKPRTAKQKAADKRASRRMKGIKPTFGKK